ncbi:MAG: plasmid stabilization protein [Burkholderiales bacterium RIFCSPLOWO2_12_FULL_61_40]|nr:MAG: plasmid stabilization protein [Burkholderiales bacterium RIFCSPLOWO2_12_FULL_61_40]
MVYTVQFSTAAEEDLERLFDFILQRELESASGDLDIPERALQAIKDGIGFLRSSPFACRKLGDSPFVRELVITFGSAGYVALYEIVDNSTVVIGAIRHQREDDYH